MYMWLQMLWLSKGLIKLIACNWTKRNKFQYLPSNGIVLIRRETSHADFTDRKFFKVLGYRYLCYLIVKALFIKAFLS